jgi:hypothetical protein
MESQQAGTLARKRRVQYLVLAGFAAAAVIVALILISQSGGSDSGGGTPSNLQGAQQVTAQLSGIPQSGAVLGDASAPVSVIEYGDPQCSSCKFFSEQVAPQLISGDVKPGKVGYDFRPFLIIGPDSKPAMCPGHQQVDYGSQRFEVGRRHPGREQPSAVVRLHWHAVDCRAGPQRAEGHRRLDDPKPSADPSGDPAGLLARLPNRVSGARRQS